MPTIIVHDEHHIVFETFGPKVDGTETLCFRHAVIAAINGIDIDATISTEEPTAVCDHCGREGE